MPLAPTLLTVLRGGLLVMPCLPLLVSGAFGITEPLLFPAITLKHFVFRGLVAVLLALYGVLVCLQPRWRPRWSPATVVVAAFLGVVALADAFGFDPQRSIWSSLERMEGLVGLLHLGAFFLVASAVFDARVWWVRFGAVSLGCAAVVGVWGVLQWLGQTGVLALPAEWVRTHHALDDVRFYRADVCFGSPVFLGIYMQTHVFLAVWYAVGARRMPLRIALVALAVLCFWVCHLTQTRVAELGLATGGAVALGLLALGRPRGDRVRHAALAGLAAVGAVLALLAALIATNSALLSQVPGLLRMRFVLPSLERRTLLWDIAWDGFLARPFLGWGQENFSFLFDRHYHPEMYVDLLWFDQPHNVFLGWLVAGGVLGFAAYVALFGLPFWLLWRRGGVLASARDRRMLSALLVGYGTFNLLQLDNLGSYLVFFAVLAWLESAGRAARPPGDAVWPRWPLAVAVLAGALLLVGSWQLHAPAWRVARGVMWALEQGGAVRTADGRVVPAMAQVVAIDSFARTEAREQLLEMAEEVRDAAQIPEAFKRELLELAVREMRDELAERRVSVKSLLMTGRVLNVAGRHREALPLLEQALEMAPQKQVVLQELATAHLSLGDGARALELVERAYRLAPGYKQAALIYAVVALFESVRRPELGAVAEQLVDDLYPAGVWRVPDSRLVEALLFAKRFDLLARLYRRAVDAADAAVAQGKARPDEVAKAYIALARAWADAGDNQRAVATLQELIDRRPGPDVVARARGMIHSLRR